MDFTNKVVLVTGASSGIGAATAKLFASHGATLSLVGRNEARLLQVAKICEDLKQIKPLCLLLDLTMDANCEEVVRKTVEHHKKIDVLINCAGKVSVTSLFDNNMEIFDELMTLNLRLPYKMVQLCLPHLKKTKGNVVNVFGAPLRVRPGFLPFAMIRDALERFTKAGALELVTEGVKMNAVRPGITRTNVLANFNVDDDCVDMVYSKIASAMPNNVIIEPEEIAKTILYAASDTSPNLNGANLIVDGAASSY
ncbi:hypothetical protein K1T71_013974 [Dendrolimus kikuchii]|uniref:Uncharacterized protein n=1 Tax=Dendrolimus kikuchii TaxID=765133 RepID=A0ACC1CG94_9NEOP|nr:hypothetical protein K1T71_013974 [Dendrolimus kikuchii]